MAIIEISSRAFRDNQRAMLDLADNGNQIKINRGRNRSYLITQLNKGDVEETISPELARCIEEGLESIRRGEGTEYNAEEFRKRYGL